MKHKHERRSVSLKYGWPSKSSSCLWRNTSFCLGLDESKWEKWKIIIWASPQLSGFVFSNHLPGRAWSGTGMKRMKQRPHIECVVRVEFRWGPSQAPHEGWSQAAVPGAGDPPGCREPGPGEQALGDPSLCREVGGGGSRRWGVPAAGAVVRRETPQTLSLHCFQFLQQAAVLSFLTDEGPGLREAQPLFHHHTVIACWAEIQRLLWLLVPNPACFQAHGPTLCSRQILQPSQQRMVGAGLSVEIKQNTGRAPDPTQLPVCPLGSEGCVQAPRTVCCGSGRCRGLGRSWGIPVACAPASCVRY